MLKLCLLLVLSLSFLLVLFGLTNPENIYVGVFFVPVTLILISFSLFFYIVSYLVKSKISKQKRLYTTVYVGILCTIWLLFYSSIKVAWVDIILITSILSLGLLYINRY